MAALLLGGGGAPTPTATVAFSQGAPTPTADSGFGFTRALEGGAHDAWGGKNANGNGAAPPADDTVTAALVNPKPGRKSMAPVPPGNRRVTMGIQGVQGIAHPADRRKSRAPFALPNATQMLGGATPTVDLDSRGKNVMGTNTFDFVYGGNPSGSTPTVTAAVFNATPASLARDVEELNAEHQQEIDDANAKLPALQRTFSDRNRIRAEIGTLLTLGLSLSLSLSLGLFLSLSLFLSLTHT